MRPEGRGDHDSLYFTYPTFTAGPAAELTADTGVHPVVIVGAGPVGMTAALSLASQGVRSILIEKKNTFNDGSRAICIARASYQILQQIGAVEPFLTKALGWTRGRSFHRGMEILVFEMSHSESEKYLPMYNLQQQYIEQYLWEACARSDLIEMRWESEVTEVKMRGDGVGLRVASPHGSYGLEARYLLAADGARSPIRAMLKLRLHGQNFEGNYVIADVRMRHDYPTERRAFFDPPGNPGGTVLIHKQPDDIWRIDYQLKPGEAPAEALKEANLRARVGAILDDIGHAGPWDLEWWSLYTANTLCLDDYRHGPVFFIGDSAHIVPIFGVRGLNNGMADAHNLAWKLAYVLNGRADPALLDSYTPERRGATLDVFANATKSARFMTPPTRGWALARDAALSLARSQPFARQFANPRQMEPYTYAASPLTLYPLRDRPFKAGTRTGAAMSNVRLTDGGFLLDRVGKGFAALVFADKPLSPALTACLAAMQARDPQFTVLTVAMGGAKIDGALDDGDGAIARSCDARPGTVYLLRPDLHVAGRWKSADPAEITASFTACLGGRKG